MHLSPHFTLAELTTTQHRGIDNEATPEVLVRLSILATEFLEPLRERFGRLLVTSGYRSPVLNRRIGGSKRSAHMDGCAADLIPLDMDEDTHAAVIRMAKWVRDESGLDFDQVIAERAGKSVWLHLGMAPPWVAKPRRQALRMERNQSTGRLFYFPLEE